MNLTPMQQSEKVQKINKLIADLSEEEKTTYRIDTIRSASCMSIDAYCM